VYKYAPASKDQTESHLHSQQVNARSISSSTKGLPASHSATVLRTYNHHAGSPRNGRFKSTLPVVSQAGSQNFRKEDLRVSNVLPMQRALQVYLTGCVASRLKKRPQRGPTSIQCVPPRNGLASSPHQRLVPSSPFQGQQLPACVHVTTAENSGVSTWVSRTFDNPQVNVLAKNHC
jgi:hypothetical protein